MNKKTEQYLERVEQLREVRKSAAPQSIRLNTEKYLLEILDLIWESMTLDEKREIERINPEWPRKENR